MSHETWGKRPRRPKQKRDNWSKPKRGRRKKQWGVDPKAAKEAKQWGHEPLGAKEKGGGLLSKIGKSRKGGWISQWLRPERVSLVKYYHKLDQLQAGAIQAGVRDQMVEDANRETIGARFARFIEQMTGRRLSSGQIDQVRSFAKETVTPTGVGRFVLRIFGK